MLLKAAFASLLALAPLHAHAAPPEDEAKTTRPCRALADGERVLIDVHDAPLTDLARIVSCSLEVNVLFTPTQLASKRVTVLSARPVDSKGLWGLWLAALAENDLVTERRGAYHVVRPAR